MTVMLAAERTAAPAALPVPRRADALSLTEMTPADVWRFCEKLADTPLLPDQYRRQPASVLWAMEYGRALGLDVVTTITTIHVIKGKPSQSADLMLSRTRAAGHRVRIQPGNGECTVSIWRADDPEFENRVTWTLADAVTAGLCEIRNDRPYSRSSKGEPQAWEKYPRAMLRARAISECVRMASPEVLHGAIYTPEELGAVIDQDGNPLDVQPQFERQAPAQDQWEQAAPAPVVQHPAEAPSKSTTPAGRDYLHEAMAAPDAATVRLIWADAKAEGARPEYLGQIAEVGRQRAIADEVEKRNGWTPGAAEEAPDPTGPAPHSASDALAESYNVTPAADPLPGAPDDPRARGMAVVEMYAAGRDNSLTPGEVQQAFTARYGHGVDAATAAELAEFTADLTAAAGAR